MKRTTKKQARWIPQPWQIDPNQVETSTVQYWKGGTMLTAMMTKEVAQEKVRNGSAFVITGQAIGALTLDGQPDD